MCMAPLAEYEEEKGKEIARNYTFTISRRSEILFAKSKFKRHETMAEQDRQTFTGIICTRRQITRFLWAFCWDLC